jgi:transposase
MARKRMRMEKVRTILRYSETTQLSERQIARAMNVSRTVVGKYVQAFRSSGLRLEELEGMSDSELSARLAGTGKPPKSARYTALCARFPAMLKELRKKGVTLELLWEEYLRECPQGYQYSQFCYHFHSWRRTDERMSMHIDHKAGDKMFVDYAGAKLAYTDPLRGREHPVEVFVAILGASELTYVEASESQQQQEWIRSNERALWYFGGVPEALVPDSLKSAVTESDPYEPGINPAFDDFAAHYGLVIVPARVRKARDKALVENAVHLVYQRIYARLRNRTFYSLGQLNEAIRELLEQHNERPFSRLAFSRRQLFEEIERPVLRPLPTERYPIKTTQMATIRYNYHVELTEDRHYYSVPHYLRAESGEKKPQAKIVYDERVVAIYYDNVRIAQHLRDRTPNGYTTAEGHMPPRHRWYAKWTPERFLSWAHTLGEEVQEAIRQVLDSRRYPQQAYNTCMGILNLEKKYGASRLNKACRRALSFQMCSYRRISNILKQGLEEDSQPQLEVHVQPPAVHENLRGSGYYN